MKKFLSPILHILFLAPIYFLLAVAIFHMNFIQNDIQLFLFLGIITIGTLLVTNRVMSKIDKITKPKIADHFRQSAFLYLSLPYIFLLYPYSGCQSLSFEDYHPGCERELFVSPPELFIGFLNISLIIVLLAIAVNICYLLYLRFYPRKAK